VRAALGIALLVLLSNAYPLTVSQQDNLPNTLKGWQKLEQEILKQAERDIERYRKSDVLIKVLDAEGKPLRGAQIEVHQISRDFLFGCNFFGYGFLGSEERNEKYAQAFLNLFNYATVPFYWHYFESEPGHIRWEWVDKIVRKLAPRGVAMKGHPLVWLGPNVPGWARKPYPELKKLLERRVRQIVSTYKGKITYWDVVNEPNSNRGAPDVFELDFHQMVDLTKEALQWVKEEDPNAYCVVNDFDIIGDTEGKHMQYKFFAALLAVDAPFDAIGIQAHFIERRDYWTIAKTLEKYSEFGKPLHLTEITPLSAGDWGDKYYMPGEWTEESQAEFVKGLYTIAFSKPAVEAITWWDLCDAWSWLDNGGLLRAELSPKPAYKVLDELLNQRWKTHTKGRTNSTGQFRFRGFHGEYEVLIRKNNKETRAKIHVAKDGKNIFTIRMGISR